MKSAGLAVWVLGEKRSVWQGTVDLFLLGEMIKKTTPFTA